MDGGDVRRSMAEIDTRAPFRSVKEAVSLFGEKVLAGELYHPNNLKQMVIKRASNEKSHGRGRPETAEPVRRELEETRQSLEKAKQESEVMASSLSSLQRELEKTKLELDQLKKDQESEKHVLVENCTQQYIEFRPPSNNSTMMSPAEKDHDDDHHHEEMEFQKKRYVSFADPPSVTSNPRGVVKVDGELGDGVFLERQRSVKKKKKHFIPLIGGIFSRKKGTQQISV